MTKHLYLIVFLLCSYALFAQPADFHQTGPILFPTNISGQIQGIGRTTQLKFDPIDDNTIWATTSSGGLYVSHDNGVSWNVTGTDALPPGNCASVCIDYTDNNIVYLGTGDPNYYYDSYGIYKSTDGGATWNPANANIGNRMALEIIMHPTNHNILIAATTDGIWRTVNGGAGWTEQVAGGQFTDMIANPAMNGVLYAVTYAGAYYRSADWGITWSDISSEISVPGGDAGGTRLAVSESDPDRVYVGVVAGQCSIYKSTDAGLHFTMVKTDYPNLNGYDGASSGQGNYNFDMTADPDDPDKVYVACHVVWKSTDAGETWTQYTDWWADCHTDMHMIVHNPHDHSMILDANDGGIFVSYDEGDNWDEYADGLGATEIYHAAQSNLERDIVSIGTQDNGELYYGYGTWYCNRGGDWGSRMFFDYNTFNKVYYNNGYRRIVTGGDENWNAPFDPNAASVRFGFSPDAPNTGYVSQYEVWRCDDLSASPSWTQITDWNKQIKALAVSPVDINDVWAMRFDARLEHTVNATALAPTWAQITFPYFSDNNVGIKVLKSDPDILYIYSYSRVYRYDNATGTFDEITEDLPAVNINGIYIDDYSDDESVYVANAFGVYYRNNTMDHWENYSQGLPTIAEIQDLMFFNDGSPNSVIRVGYYGKGVWESPIIQPHPIPAAAFIADQFVICPGETIHFTDESTDNTDTWTWTFAGGTPATSTAENPDVTYYLPGIYTVTLTATNTNGSDVETKTSYITVSPIHEVPLVEGFEGTFLPLDWTKTDANLDGVFWEQDNAGSYGASDHSARFDNFYFDVSGARDDMITPEYNLSTAISATLQFDVAYAKYSNDYPDSLAVKVSKDCGVSWDYVYMKTSDELATAPDFTDDLFVPASNEWRTETIDLSAYLGEEKVAVAFENIGHYGQGIYIDNVNIDAINPVQDVSENGWEVYPNPAHDILLITCGETIPPGTEYTVFNGMGQKILQSGFTNSGYAEADMHIFPSGIYFIQIERDGKITGRIQFEKLQ